MQRPRKGKSSGLKRVHRLQQPVERPLMKCSAVLLVVIPSTNARLGQDCGHHPKRHVEPILHREKDSDI